MRSIGRLLPGVLVPIKKVKGGYKWGNRGKTYPSKQGAARQARAAYASGYKGKAKTKKGY